MTSLSNPFLLPSASAFLYALLCAHFLVSTKSRALPPMALLPPTTGAEALPPPTEGAEALPPPTEGAYDKN